MDKDTIEIIGLFGWVTAQAVAVLGTPEWLPKPIVGLINFIAGNYAKAKNLPR